MDDICSQVFSNDILKSKGAIARNMKLSDIIGTNRIDATVTTIKNKNGNYGSQTYTINNGTYPQIWLDDEENSPSILIREMSKSEYIGSQSSDLRSRRPISNFYDSQSVNQNSYSSDEYYNMVIGDALEVGGYWLATRESGCIYKNYCEFKMSNVNTYPMVQRIYFV